ncbi:MAG TPA: cache domain-containing protein, partial [Methanothrix sp.]|nr:cache domain-containing protein [Methanothrix sp.]
MDGLRGKLLAVLIAFALLPMACIGLLSFIEMNRASVDVQNNITSLSTTLNRSALAVGPDEADQVQLAVAKARQYEQFFLRIASENELIAAYAAASSANESCVTPPGIWIAPIGANQTVSDMRDDTVKSLCAPAMVMQELHKADSSLYLSYIGTEDGVLAVWPYSNKTLSNAALFGYKDMSYYSQAKRMMKTIWTGPYVDSKGEDVITVTTPFYRDGEFTGIAGMDVSLDPIFDDLSSLKGRGYPFIVDSSGLIIYRPKNKPENRLRDLFASENLIKSDDAEVRGLGKSLLKGSSGAIVVGLGSGDGYVAYARIDSLGWTLCIAYVAEEMSLPARYI